MSFYTVEQWTIRDVAKAFRDENGDQSNRRVVIPIFQRGLRWEPERRASFIDSLTKGYPFGSLLFAKQESNTYSVVDGLQRGSTVSNYVYNPLAESNIDTIDDDVLTKIRYALFPGNDNYTINLTIQNIILNYFHEKKSFDNVQTFEIAQSIISQIPTAEDKYDCAGKINSALTPFYNNIKNTYERICGAIVPIIVYSGPNELLCEIFNRINKKGIPLNDYEIYAAIWSTKKYRINTSDIVQKVINKYLVLNQNGYKIEGFDCNDLLVNKELTAFEYLFGLGKYWSEKFSCLQVTNNKEPDKVNEISFEIIDACLNSTKSIANLDKQLQDFNINKLQRRIEEAIKFVEDSIALIGSFKGNRRTLINLHSKYQIVSLIACTFRKMYDVNNLEHKKSSWENYSAKYSKLLLSHYVADIISNEWHDGGGSKVYLTVKENHYDDEITAKYWISLLDSYYQGQLANRQEERFSNPTNADCVILNCIYVNLFTAADQLSTKKFDIEHLATKEKMRKILSKLNGVRLPVSCISNLCYLPENINRGKKEKILYEAPTVSMPISEIESKFSFTMQSDFNWIYKDYTNDNAAQLTTEFETYLNNRFKIIKEKFLLSFGYTI